MPNSLSPLPLETADASPEVKTAGRPPLRHRISKKVDAIGASVPTCVKMPKRSVTPIY